MKKKRIAIVGAGITGITLAYLLKKKYDVCIYEKKPHALLGGLCAESSGALKYTHFGPHIFYTDNSEVRSIIKKWGGLSKYKHEVKTYVKGIFMPYPINETTLKYFKNEEEAVKSICTDYEKKKWGKDYRKALKPHVVSVRKKNVMKFFTTKWQGLPKEGYRAWFEKALKDVTVFYNFPLEYRDIKRSRTEHGHYDHFFITANIDQFYGYIQDTGFLKWKGVTFTEVYIDKPHFYKWGVVNFPTSAVPFIRATDYNHLYMRKTKPNIVQYEYPSDSIDIYPIRDAENLLLLRKYQQMKRPYMTFLGRGGRYKYMNMSEAMEDAIKAAERWL